MGKKLQFWAPVLAGGLILGIGGAFFVFGAPPEVAEPLQKLKNLVGQNVCPSGTQMGKFNSPIPEGNPLEATSAKQQETFCVAPADMQKPTWKPFF